MFLSRLFLAVSTYSMFVPQKVSPIPPGCIQASLHLQVPNWRRWRSCRGVPVGLMVVLGEHENLKVTFFQRLNAIQVYASVWTC